MPSAAKASFDLNLAECREAITIYNHLKGQGYTAGFGLRFVWIAAVSAFEHYITELVIEETTKRFANGHAQTDKLQNEKIPLSSATQFVSQNAVQAVVVFHHSITQAVRMKSFQGADGVADGLSYFWTEPNKWTAIAQAVGLPKKDARAKLNNITARRHLIAHNADMDLTTGARTPAELADAQEVIRYLVALVEAIERIAV